MRYIVRTTEQMAILAHEEQSELCGAEQKRVQFYEVIDFQTNEVMLGTLDRDFAHGKAMHLEDEWTKVSVHGGSMIPATDLI